MNRQWRLLIGGMLFFVLGVLLLTFAVVIWREAWLGEGSTFGLAIGGLVVAAIGLISLSQADDKFNEP